MKNKKFNKKYPNLYLLFLFSSLFVSISLSISPESASKTKSNDHSINTTFGELLFRNFKTNFSEQSKYVNHQNTPLFKGNCHKNSL